MRRELVFHLESLLLRRAPPLRVKKALVIQRFVKPYVELGREQLAATAFGCHVFSRDMASLAIFQVPSAPKILHPEK